MLPRDVHLVQALQDPHYADSCEDVVVEDFVFNDPVRLKGVY